MASKAPNPTRQQPNREELFQMAVSAAKSGQRQPARVMFQQILAQSPNDLRVIMWLAKLSAKPEDRERLLRRALEIRPGYEPAIQALEQMTRKRSSTRNRTIFNVGVGVYVALILLVTLWMIISAASVPL